MRTNLRDERCGGRRANGTRGEVDGAEDTRRLRRRREGARYVGNNR